jgi:hypothetical protein
MDICLDCKDKVVKFYHFKRKAKEVQKQKPAGSQNKAQKTKERASKIVHNILDIVQNYTERCSISRIKVDERSKKLIIESEESEILPGTSQSVRTIPTTNHSNLNVLPSTSLLASNSKTIIKQEPDLMIAESNSEPAFVNESMNVESMASEDCQNSFGSFYDSSEPGTSHSVGAPRGVRKYSQNSRQSDQGKFKFLLYKFFRR